MEKAKARQFVRRAILYGILAPPRRCWICDSTKNVGYHHKDYNKPLDVTPLCASCHWKAHGGKKGHKRWTAKRIITTL